MLAIGDIDHRELSEAAELVARDPGVRLSKFSDDNAGLHDLILVLQARPGSVEPTAVTQVSAKLPLAGVVVVLGTWCEGETRTGRPIPCGHRVFWYHFAQWWQHVRRAWDAGEPTLWQQPPAMAVTPPGVSRALVAIDTPDAEAADVLLTACETLGTSGIWTPRWRPRPANASPEAGIWVGGQLSGTEQADLSRFRSALPAGVPLVVLLDFPRRDAVATAKQIGATAVLGKPWRLEHLAMALEG